MTGKKTPPGAVGLGIWIAFGSLFGVVVGDFIDNVALGIALGLGLGVVAWSVFIARRNARGES
jgi:hypothetical protein